MAKNEMVALGLIYSEPCHTYVLDRFINEMRLEQWANISKASIYNTLKRLASQGCVTVTSEKVGPADRTLEYQVSGKDLTLTAEHQRTRRMSGKEIPFYDQSL